MSQTPIVLYQYPRAGRLESLSPFCVKVHLALRAKGLAYEVRDLFAPWTVKRVNPRGRLPAIDLGGRRLADSTEIIEALDAAFPERPLVPTERVDRARARVLEDWADEVLYFYVVYWRWRIDPPSARAFGAVPRLLRPLVRAAVRRTIDRRLHHQGTGVKPVERVIEEVRTALETVGVLAEASPTGFLLGGPGPTSADIAVFAQIDGLYWDALPRAVELVRADARVLRWYEAVNAATRGVGSAGAGAGGASSGGAKA